MIPPNHQRGGFYMINCEALLKFSDAIDCAQVKLKF